jgi:hypothetical protein
MSINMSSDYLGLYVISAYSLAWFHLTLRHLNYIYKGARK